MKTQWTPERRAQQAQAIQTWQPWKQATGPRTIEGKAKASRNAYAGATRQQLRALGRVLRERAQWSLNDQRLSAARPSLKKPQAPPSADKPRWTEPPGRWRRKGI
jgi:hypothetical protein